MLLTEHFVMSLAAPRKSGKSFFITTMMRKGLFNHFDHIIIMCPTLKFNDDYLEFMEKKNVTCLSDVTRGTIDELFQKQSECMNKVREAQRKKTTNKLIDDEPEPEPLSCPDTLLILDDCVDSGVFNFRGSVDRIAERGRHINLSLILSSQRQSAISRSVRINSDYFITFSPYSVSELEQFLDQFVSRNQRKAMREKIAEIYKVPFQFIVLDNSEKDVTQKLKTSNAEAFVRGDMEVIVIS